MKIISEIITHENLNKGTVFNLVKMKLNLTRPNYYHFKYVPFVTRLFLISYMGPMLLGARMAHSPNHLCPCPWWAQVVRRLTSPALGASENEKPIWEAENYNRISALPANVGKLTLSFLSRHPMPISLNPPGAPNVPMYTIYIEVEDISFAITSICLYNKCYFFIRYLTERSSAFNNLLWKKTLENFKFYNL